MAFKLFEVFGEVLLKGGDKVATELGVIDQNAEKAGVGFSKFGKIATGAIGGVAIAIGALAVKVGVEGVKAADEFGKKMSNVATLLDGDVTAKVNKLGDEVLDLALKTGKTTDDLTNGLYEVISAFGDTAESMGILEVATKSATAGGAETADAIRLLSSVTKAYGDTSLEANQKVSDMALNVVKLGQTTFPELAGAMGNVTAISKTRGITQEEVMGTVATLTGVIGTASEVSTGYRQAVEGIAKPSTEMGFAIGNVAMKLAEMGEISGDSVDSLIGIKKAIQENQLEMAKLDRTTKEGALAYKDLETANRQLTKQFSDISAGMGKTVIETKGLHGTLELLKGAVNNDEVALMGLWGSLEAGNFALSATGAQSDNFKEKVNAMGQSAGVTQESFERVRKGTDQLKASLEVLYVKVGQELLPIFDKVVNFLINNAPPAIEFISARFKAFAELISEVSKIVIAFSKGFKEVLQKVNDDLETFFSQIKSIWSGITQIFSNAGAKLRTELLEIKNFFIAVFTSIKNNATNLITSMINNVKSLIQGLLNKILAIPNTIAGVFDKVKGAISGITSRVEQVRAQTKERGFAKGGIVTQPTRALIGEGGENEAVIPLNNKTLAGIGKGISGAMGKMANAINITINNPIVRNDKDINLIGNELIKSLKANGVY